MEKVEYGPSRDLGGRDGLPAANPKCVCSPMQAMFCVYGHMLECHFPLTCDQAHCSHLARYRDGEDCDG